jgi:hypothetical protein
MCVCLSLSLIFLGEKSNRLKGLIHQISMREGGGATGLKKYRKLRLPRHNHNNSTGGNSQDEVFEHNTQEFCNITNSKSLYI